MGRQRFAVSFEDHRRLRHSTTNSVSHEIDVMVDKLAKLAETGNVVFEILHRDQRYLLR